MGNKIIVPRKVMLQYIPRVGKLKQKNCPKKSSAPVHTNGWEMGNKTIVPKKSNVPVHTKGREMGNKIIVIVPRKVMRKYIPRVGKRETK